MKRATAFISILFVFILVISNGCASSQSDNQLDRIESQLQALTSTISATQQELASIKKSLADAQDSTRLLQQQIQEAQQTRASASIYQPTAVRTVTVLSDQYTPYYNSPNYYPYEPLAKFP
jgi:septal ring factor EnvC (AmiA/AmiB activator)